MAPKLQNTPQLTYVEGLWKVQLSGSQWDCASQSWGGLSNALSQAPSASESLAKVGKLEPM